jgi:hypothetical protein
MKRLFPSILLFLIFTLIHTPVYTQLIQRNDLIMRNGDDREYKELHIFCMKKFYYITFDLIDDENIIPEIYQPMEHHLFAIRHEYIEPIKQVIESEKFLDEIQKLYSEYKPKIKELITKKQPKIISALSFKSQGLISTELYKLNRDYRNLINELEAKLNENIIENLLLGSPVVQDYPEYAEMEITPRQEIFEEFKAVTYTTKNLKRKSFKEPELLDLVNENMEIYKEWAMGFDKLKRLTSRLQMIEKDLKRSAMPSKIRSLCRQLNRSSHRWLAGMVKIEIDYLNYMENLKVMEEFLEEKIKVIDKVTFQFEGETDEEIEERKREIEMEEQEKQYEDSEDRRERREENKRIKTVNRDVKKIKSEIEIIHLKRPVYENIHKTMIGFKALIDKKETEARNYIREKREKPWRDHVKNWWMQYDTVPRKVYNFPRVYNEKKQGWKDD